MKISVQKRRTQASESIQEYALEKVEHLSHYFPEGIISVDIFFDEEKDRKIFEIVAHLVRKKMLQASAEAEDMQVAIDTSVDKLKTQLLKYKDQLQDKRAHAKPEVDSSHGNHSNNKMQRTEVYLRKPMTPEEALLQLESYQKKDFLIFLNIELGRINILHRLSNGEYELIEPVY